MKPAVLQNHYKPYRFFGLYIGGLVCLLVWLLSISALLDRPSNYLYDLFSRHLPERQRTEDPIILIKADFHSQYNDEKIWIEALHILKSNGAKQIIFTFIPHTATSEFFEQAADIDGVILGRSVTMTDTTSHFFQLEPLPQATKNITITTGALHTPEEINGIQRNYRTQFQTEDQVVPALAVATARQVEKQIKSLPPQFRIDFIGQPDHLPTITVDDLFSGKIIREVIANKCVLIGLVPPHPFQGYNTPLSTDSIAITPLDYQGLALQTIMEDRILHQPGTWEILICLLLVICLNLTVHQFLGTFAHIIVSVCFFCALLLLNSALLFLFQIWIPVVEIVLVYILFQTFLAFRDNTLRNRLALQIILDQSFKRREQVMPKSFFRSPDYWALVVNMVNQTLNLKRFIFLEAVEGDHRVKEVISLNCSLDDIKERRRDYHRTPYKTALEQNRSIPVNSYFTDLPNSEESYLVPLNFAGQVQGFWAFTLNINEETQNNILLAAVNNFAIEIGEMLFRRKQWVEQSRWYDHPLRKILNMEKQNEPYREVSRILAFLVRRLSILESVFNALDTATILYNPFGVVIQSNDKMISLLKSHGLNAYELSALDLAVRITGASHEQIRKYLGRVIINFETVQLPITVSEEKHQTLMLRIRPLVAANKDEDDELKIQPIELNGILFEITDVSSLMEINRAKESLFHYSLNHLQDELSTLSTQFENLEDTSLPTSTNGHHSLLGRTKKLQDFVLSLDTYLGQENNLENSAPYPVGLYEIVQKSAESMQPAANSRQLSFAVEIPAELPLVHVVPNRFIELLESLIQVLIADAFEDSVITIDITRSPTAVVCRLKNEGVGIPNDTFQRFLDPSAQVDRTDFLTINQIRPELDYWQADLSGSSDFGKGIVFELTLAPFTP